MVKKVIALSLAAVLSASLLVGCGGSTSGNTAADSSSGKQASTVAKTEPEAKAEPVTLKFLGYKSGKELGALPDINKAFQDANPGVTIEYDAIPTTNGYADVLKARLATGDGPDIFQIHCGNEVNNLVDAGYVADLSDQPWIGNVLESFVKFTAYKGKNYVLPVESAGIGMFANISVLEKNGLSLPTNWGELAAACDKLKAAGITPFIFGNKSGWSGAVMSNMAVLAEHKDFDDNVMTDIFDGKVKYSQYYGAAFTKYKTIIDKGWCNDKSSLGMEFNDAAVAEFAKGNSAFLMGGTWMISQIRDALKGQNIVFSACPMQDNGPANGLLLAGTCLAVNESSKNLDAAKKLVAFWADDKNMQLWVKSQGAFTTLKGGTSTAEPEAKPFGDTVAAGNGSLGTRWDDRIKADMWSALCKEIQMLTLKKHDAEKAGKELDDAFTKGQALQKK